MILTELKNIKFSRKDSRNFGLLVGGVLLALAGFKFWKDKDVSAIFYSLLSVGGGLMTFGLVLPTVLKPLYYIWMGFSVIMGFIMTKIILTLLFFLLLTPLKLFAFFFGTHFIDLKTNKNKASYWIIRTSKKYDPVKSELQF